MNVFRILLVLFLILALDKVIFAQQKTIRLDPAAAKKIQEMERQEEQRRKMESRMPITRSDMGESVRSPSSSADNSKGTLEEQFRREAAKREQYHGLADSVDASRGKAGLLYIPHVIQKSREIDKQQEAEQREKNIPNQFRQKSAPNAIYPANR